MPNVVLLKMLVQMWLVMRLRAKLVIYYCSPDVCLSLQRPLLPVPQSFAAIL